MDGSLRLMSRMFIVFMLLITPAIHFVQSTPGNNVHHERAPYAITVQYAAAQLPGNTGSSPDADIRAHITNASVSGFYNLLGRVQLTLPQGWHGFEVYAAYGNIVIVAVSPGTLTDFSDLTTSDPLMFVVVAAKDDVDRAPGLGPPFLSNESGIREDNNVVIDRNASLECSRESSTIVIVDQTVAQESRSTCHMIATNNSQSGVSNSNTSSDNTKILKSVLLDSAERWYSVMVLATPEAFFDRAEADFDLSVKTMKAANTKDIQVPFGGIRSTAHSVIANNSDVQIEVKSSSNITAFELDEAKKQVSFRAEGLGGTQGLTEVTIGRVLEGPYVVTMNGESFNDYQLVDEDNSRETRMVLKYEHEITDFTITGITVVPEFQSNFIVIFSAIITTMIVLYARNFRISQARSSAF